MKARVKRVKIIILARRSSLRGFLNGILRWWIGVSALNVIDIPSKVPTTSKKGSLKNLITGAIPMACRTSHKQFLANTNTFSVNCQCTGFALWWTHIGILWKAEYWKGSGTSTTCSMGSYVVGFKRPCLIWDSKILLPSGKFESTYWMNWQYPGPCFKSSCLRKSLSIRHLSAHWNK